MYFWSRFWKLLKLAKIDLKKNFERNFKNSKEILEISKKFWRNVYQKIYEIEANKR